MQDLGQNKFLKEIQRRLSSPPSKFVVYGPNQTGKYEFVLNLIREKSSFHDLLEVDGSIDGVRQSINFIKSFPIVGEIRFVLIDGRSGITEPAQDAYLKVCEETPETGVIVFVVSDKSIFRPALFSRLDFIKFDFCQKSDEEIDDFVLSVSKGRLGLVNPIYQNLSEMKEFYELIKATISGSPDFTRTPKLIGNWSKLEKNVKDATIAVLEFSVNTVSGPRLTKLLDFSNVLSSVPSINAEVHWWRCCL